MFLSLYYEHYAEKCNAAYWEDKISLPYQVLVPDEKEREELSKRLDKLGFTAVNGENGYRVMYVNFTLKRYGRAVKVAKSSAINEILMTKEQFEEDILRPYCEDPEVRERLGNNYLLSAAINYEKTIFRIKENSSKNKQKVERYDAERSKTYRTQIIDEINRIESEIKRGSDSIMSPDVSGVSSGEIGIIDGHNGSSYL